jgi:hypothetical protein
MLHQSIKGHLGAFVTRLRLTVLKAPYFLGQDTFPPSPQGEGKDYGDPAAYMDTANLLQFSKVHRAFPTRNVEMADPCWTTMEGVVFTTRAARNSLVSTKWWLL